MKNLTDENKKDFENQINNINETEESKVLCDIEGELKKLKVLQSKNQSHKMEDMISNAEFLHQILLSKDFPLTQSTKKWIIFGLGYLISDFDLIPDIIPRIGYNDDALILQWVMYMIDDEINKFNEFRRAKDISESGNVIKELLKGSGECETIIIPGFLTGTNDIDSYKQWTKKIRDGYGKFSNSGIGIVNWDLNHLKEFTKIIKIVDHQLSLKPVYESEKFLTEWQQAKMEFTFLGQALARNIEEIYQANPNKELILISFNIGTYAAATAINTLAEGRVSGYFTFGGATNCMEMPQMGFTKVNKVYNFFSNHDFALKFIFDNFESENCAIGLSPIVNSTSRNIKNFNVTDKIHNHFEYRQRLSEFLKEKIN